MHRENNKNCDHLKNQLGIAVDNALFQPPEKKEAPRWQPVLAAALTLSVFRRANSELEADAYLKLLSLLSEQYWQIGRLIDTEPKWSETPSQLRITGAYEHWVGHDETISQRIEMTFERLSGWDEPVEWQSSQMWSCEGEYPYLDESESWGDTWNYYAMSHKAWLLKKPFGLHGVWSFAYRYTNQRS